MAYEILEKLTYNGFVKKRTSSDWSKHMFPKFEITPEGVYKIRCVREKVLEIIDELI